MNITREITKEATRQGLTLEHLAEALELSPQRLEALLTYRGGAALYLSELLTIATALHLPAAELIRRAEQHHTPSIDPQLEAWLTSHGHTVPHGQAH